MNMKSSFLASMSHEIRTPMQSVYGLLELIYDEPIPHATQEMVPDYSEKVDSYGVGVINQTKCRHVLTTRRDGDKTFKIRLNDSFDIYTSNG